MVNQRERRIIEKNTEKLPLSGNLFRKNKRRISVFKLTKLIFVSISSIAIVFAVIYGFINSSKTSAESINQNTILTELSKKMTLPDGDPVSMMRVSDAKNLVEQDSFYKDVRNGDYIIVYQNMMLIFDFDKGFIKNVKTN